MPVLWCLKFIHGAFGIFNKLFATRQAGADALQRCVTAATLIGSRALLVNALIDAAGAFWRRHGFTSSKDAPLLLFRSLLDIAASLAAAEA